MKDEAEKKKRQMVLHFKNDPKFYGGNLRIDLASGKVFAYHDSNFPIPLKEVKLSFQHERELKDAKIISSTSAPSDFLHMNEFGALAQFGKVFAIDTNTTSKNISASAFVQLQVIEFSKEYYLNVHPNYGYFEFQNVERISPEIVGWYTLFQQDFFTDLLAKKCPIAVITDAHLGDLAAFNSRVKPIIDDILLPENVTLLYASADKQDTISNKLMRLVDKEAKQFLKELNQGINVKQDYQTHPFCQRYRFLHKSGFVIEPNYVEKGGFIAGPDSEMSLYGIRADTGEKELLQVVKINGDQHQKGPSKGSE